MSSELDNVKDPFNLVPVQNLFKTWYSGQRTALLREEKMDMFKVNIFESLAL